MKKQYLIIGTVVIIIILLISFAYFLLPQNSNVENSNSTFNVTTQPFLWKIEGDNPSYLYGSIHLPDKGVLTIPDVVYDALTDVDCVYTEVKLDADSQVRSAQLSILPDDETLDDLLPQDVLNRLRTYLSSKGVSYEAFSK